MSPVVQFRGKRVAIFAFAALVLIFYVYFFHIPSDSRSSDPSHSKNIPEKSNKNDDFKYNNIKHISHDDLNTENKPVLIKPDVHPVNIKDSQPQKATEIHPSLTYKDRVFYLKNEPFQIFSGTIHYFRVPPEYWKDRLLKLKAAGFNTVETYAPWNLHEETKGVFNFHGMLNVKKFFTEAHNLGLHVIFRPGPYICSEWEYGGLPGWLLADDNMKMRTQYIGFLKAVEEYLKQILREVVNLQFSKGGPIIAFQVENEYGSFGDNFNYLSFLRTKMLSNGVVEMLFTSDGLDGVKKITHLPGGFVGANFNKLSDGKAIFKVIQGRNKDLPIINTELWSGWFYHWGGNRGSPISDEDLKTLVKYLLDNKYSFNMYMFHGGTNFGFMNGYIRVDKLDAPLVTSYDYEAPVSESGELTAKYRYIRELLLAALPPATVKALPEPPAAMPAKSYGKLKIKSFMSWESILDLIEKPVVSQTPKFMEEIGQNFGFILYRSEFTSGQSVSILGHVADRGLVLVNSQPVDPLNPTAGVIYHVGEDRKKKRVDISLKRAKLKNGENILDVLVENLGRVNYFHFQSPIINQQRKGIIAASDADIQAPGGVAVNDKELKSFKIYQLDFPKTFLTKASNDKEGWATFQPGNLTANSSAPAFYRCEFMITDEEPKDTFLDMSAWTKGVVFANGVNLGRYWNAGPQFTLYLPAPFLVKGYNEVIIFELHKPALSVDLVSKPKYVF